MSAKKGAEGVAVCFSADGPIFHFPDAVWIIAVRIIKVHPPAFWIAQLPGP